jgi:hypothetical protein
MVAFQSLSNPANALYQDATTLQPVAVSQTTPLPVSGGASQYPDSSTPITGAGTGTTGAVVGTLAGAAAKTTYISGFNVSAIGGTAAVGPITVAGLKGQSFVYHMASSASGNTLQVQYVPAIPASAVNTAITVTTTANGTATGVAVNVWGYQL